MGMETPGPTPKKWMEALSAEMRFLEPILWCAKERNASGGIIDDYGQREVMVKSPFRMLDGGNTLDQSL